MRIPNRPVCFWPVISLLLLLGSQAASEDRKHVRIYQWPYLSFKPYISANGIDYPHGDIDARRAFYWGRVIGADGVAFSIRSLLPHLVEGNWYEPVYENEKQRKEIFDLVREFQQLYSKYGSDDNFLHFHAHPLLPKHPTHPTTEVKQWRRMVVEGMRQRAGLLKHAGISRLLLDLEFAGQSNVSDDLQFWFELGRDMTRAMVKEHPSLRIGFYPGLYYLMHDEVRFEKAKTGLENHRHALLKGMYESRGMQPLWYFSGYTYTIADGTVAERGSKYVWTLHEHLDGIKRVHQAALGPDIEYMPGRWDFGASNGPGKAFRWLFKQPNRSLNMMRRDYQILTKFTRYIGSWDHGTSWDEDGQTCKRFKSEKEFDQWKEGLKKAELRSHYRKHLATGEEWEVVIKADEPLNAKLRYFKIHKLPGGAIHVSGKLANDFADYVNLRKVFAGKHNNSFPLYSSKEIQWANQYKKRGFLSRQRAIETPDAKWPGKMVPEVTKN